MIYTEIYSDRDGVSHFRDTELIFEASDFSAKGRPLGRSQFTDGQSGFLTVPAGWDSGWHEAPSDGFAVLIKGEVEIEAGSGEVRRFSAGQVWRSTDTNGRGHVSRVVSEESAVLHMTIFSDPTSM